MESTGELCEHCANEIQILDPSVGFYPTENHFDNDEVTWFHAGCFVEWWSTNKEKFHG